MEFFFILCEWVTLLQKYVISALSSICFETCEILKKYLKHEIIKNYKKYLKHEILKNCEKYLKDMKF